MLLPDKHIALSESLLGLGSALLRLLNKPKALDEIYLEFSRMYQSKEYPSYHSFENVVLATSFLFSIGVLEQDEKGNVFRCD